MKRIILAIAAGLVLASCNVKERKQQTDSTAENTKAVAAAEGKEAPDFTLPSSEGMTLSLSDLRGQYVVLDFWGTWCKWCVKGIPDMKAYYEKYHGMFEILSIDVGDDEETWRQAIESYDMEWQHVITDEDSADQLQQFYNIEGYPTKIVVDPMGIITKITVGEDPAFYTYLDNLFSKK